MCGDQRGGVAPVDVAVPVVLERRSKTDGAVVRRLSPLVWGLVPSWAKDAKGGARMINARVETVAEKPAFRRAFAARRCLLPADGFYEWHAEGRKKVPYHFSLKGGGVFAFAGVWDVWRRDGQQPLHTCALITVAANEVVSPVHARMPAILLPDQFGDWLDPDAPPEDAAKAKADPGVVATACAYRSATLVAQAARLTGHEAEAREAEELATGLQAAFRQHYVTGGRIRSDCTTVYALAIVFGILSDEDTAAAGDRGVKGVPALVVGDQVFWGDDRLEEAVEAAS